MDGRQQGEQEGQDKPNQIEALDAVQTLLKLFNTLHNMNLQNKGHFAVFIVERLSAMCPL